MQQKLPHILRSARPLGQKVAAHHRDAEAVDEQRAANGRLAPKSSRNDGVEAPMRAKGCMHVSALHVARRMAASPRSKKSANARQSSFEPAARNAAGPYPRSSPQQVAGMSSAMRQSPGSRRASRDLAHSRPTRHPTKMKE